MVSARRPAWEVGVMGERKVYVELVVFDFPFLAVRCGGICRMPSWAPGSCDCSKLCPQRLVQTVRTELCVRVNPHEGMCSAFVQPSDLDRDVAPDSM